MTNLTNAPQGVLPSGVPPTLHGFPVRAALRTRDAGTLIVLVERFAHQDQYVTAIWSSAMRDSWEWGHYFATLDDAIVDLWDRARGSANPFGRSTTVEGK